MTINANTREGALRYISGLGLSLADNQVRTLAAAVVAYGHDGHAADGAGAKAVAAVIRDTLMQAGYKKSAAYRMASLGHKLAKHYALAGETIETVRREPDLVSAIDLVAGDIKATWGTVAGVDDAFKASKPGTAKAPWHESVKGDVERKIANMDLTRRDVAAGVASLVDLLDAAGLQAVLGAAMDRAEMLGMDVAISDDDGDADDMADAA